MTAKASAKKAKSDSVKSSEGGPAMLQIPEANLRLVYEWIESEKMTMPHNQVLGVLKLLGTATLVKN